MSVGISGNAFSYGDLEELSAKRNQRVDHFTIWCWFRAVRRNWPGDVVENFDARTLPRGG